MDSAKLKLEKQEEIQAQALEATLPYFRCGVDMSVGSGKTYLGLKHIMALWQVDDSRQFLVVYPTKDIKDGWDKAIKTLKCEHLLENITFSTYRSLHKQTFDYHCVYLDECQNLTENHMLFLSFYRGRILGLTGTVPESGIKGSMINEYCPIKFTYDINDGVDSGMLNDYNIIVHLLPLDTSKTYKVSKKNGQSWTTSEQASYDYWTDRLVTATEENDQKQLQICRIMRMKAMQDFPSKVDYAKFLSSKLPLEDKTIIFANYKKQADLLCTNSYHSGNKNSDLNLEAFKNGDITRLSAVLQLNEGSNIPDLKACIALHAYGNNVKFPQRMGRMMRLNPDETANVHLLCYKGTIDEKWVKDALSSYNEEKVRYYDSVNQCFINK